MAKVGALIGDRELTGKMTNLRLGVRKVRDGDQGRIIPFRLEVVDCGVDEDGEQITTCLIRWELTRGTASKSGGRPPTRHSEFKDAVAAAVSAAGETITNGKGNVRAARRDAVVMKFKEIYSGKAKDIGGAFRKAAINAHILCEVDHCKIDGVEWFWVQDEPL